MSCGASSPLECSETLLMLLSRVSDIQGDPRRRPRLTRRVQSVHGYDVSAVAAQSQAESEAAREIAMMRSLCHPNIVRLVEVIGEAPAASRCSERRMAPDSWLAVICRRLYDTPIEKLHLISFVRDCLNA